MDVSFQQLPTRRHDETNLRARRDEDEIRLCARRIGQYVRAAPQAAGVGKFAAIERGDMLSGEYQRDRALERLQCDAPGNGGLVGVAGPDDDEPRNRTQACELLDRLMRRAVLAQSNA